MKLERIVETGADVSSRCADIIASAPLPPRNQKPKKPPLTLPSQFAQQEKEANKVFSKLFKRQKWSEQALKACQELVIDPESLHQKHLAVFMTQYDGDEEMARLQRKYFQQERIKNLLRVKKWLFTQEKIVPKIELNQRKLEELQQSKAHTATKETLITTLPPLLEDKLYEQTFKRADRFRHLREVKNSKHNELLSEQINQKIQKAQRNKERQQKISQMYHTGQEQMLTASMEQYKAQVLCFSSSKSQPSLNHTSTSGLFKSVHHEREAPDSLEQLAIINQRVQVARDREMLLQGQKRQKALEHAKKIDRARSAIAELREAEWIRKYSKILQQPSRQSRRLTQSASCQKLSSPTQQEKESLLATRLQSALQSKLTQKLLESRTTIPEEPSKIESPQKPPRDLKLIEKCLKAKVKRVIMEDLTEQSHLRRLKVLDKHLKIKARLEQRHQSVMEKQRRLQLTFQVKSREMYSRQRREREIKLQIEKRAAQYQI